MYTYWDLTVSVPNNPGAATMICDALGKAGINIEGICGWGQGANGTVHVLVQDKTAARQALERAGCTVTQECEALVEHLENRPGVLAGYARKLANADINIDCLYMATDTRVAVCCNNVNAARAAWQGKVPSTTR